MPHKFVPGELCTGQYLEPERGILYRIIDVKSMPGVDVLTVVPVFGVFNVKTKFKNKRQVDAKTCRYVSLVDLGTLYMNLRQFIIDEAESKTVCTTSSSLPKPNSK